MSHKFFIVTVISIMTFGWVVNTFGKDQLPVKPAKVSKLINVNPDPNGEPWIAGGVPEMTPEMQRRIESLPILDLSYRHIVVPDKVNNSTEKFFRPIFNQGSVGSCAQASGIAYQLTYELNWENNTSADVNQNQLPSQYTYSFLNGGSGQNGSMTEEGWDVVNSIGCPNVVDYGGLTGGDATATKWMDGYDKYYNGMKRKVTSIKKIMVNTPEGINTLRQWFYDHGNGSSKGSVVNFSALVQNMKLQKLASGTPEAGKTVVVKMDPQEGGHAMTFVGYNDSIRVDYNNDGKYTNDIDINNDGKVDVKDWEIGGLIIANSWGTSWGDNGFAYMPYKLCADESKDGGIKGGYVVGIEATDDYKPKMAYKVKIQYSARNDISIKAGFSSDENAQNPEYVHYFAAFNYQGGAMKMEGGSSGKDEIEIGLDITPLLKYSNNKKNKFFLIVDAVKGGKGQVSSFSLIDYRGNAPVEKQCDQQNVAIEKGSNVLSITHESDNDDLFITTDELAAAAVNLDYSFTLEASGGKKPYQWSVNERIYTEKKIDDNFPAITDNTLKPDDVDDGYASQEIDFEFPFYGKKYKKIYLTTDGSLVFDPSFEVIRSRTSLPRCLAITPLGADLTFEKNGDDMYYKGDSKSATFRWKTTKLWGSDQVVNLDFAITLYPSGEFKIFYNKDLTDDLSGLAHGFSAGNLKDYYYLKFDNTSQIPDNHALHFIPFSMPDGIQLSKEGVLSGKATQQGKQWDLTFVCTDADGNEKVRELTFTTTNVSIVSAGTIVHRPLFSHAISPFSGNIMFTFITKTDGIVKIDVLNAAGRTLATPVNDFYAAGTHMVDWTGKNNTAEAVTSGVYFYRLTKGNTAIVQKGILIK